MGRYNKILTIFPKIYNESEGYNDSNCFGTPPPVCSILIVSYNTINILRRCLEAIMDAHINLPFEIIVVDNGSSDDSVGMICEAFPGVRLIRNDSNPGFAVATNQAIRCASGKYLLLLNSDAFIKKDLVEGMVQFLEEHTKAAAVGPKILNVDGSLQSMGFPRYGLYSLVLLPLWQKYNPWNSTSLYLRRQKRKANCIRTVGWISGCCMMLSRRSMNLVGELDESFFFYCEDVEWCHRAAHTGLQIWYLGSQEVVHQGSTSGTPFFDPSYWTTATPVFHRKTMGLMQAILVHLAFLGQGLLALALTAFPGRRQRALGVSRRFKFELAVLKSLIIELMPQGK